jgi:hypothetical protein
VPWTLVYLPSEQPQLDSDAELLRASPDVESITTSRRDSLLEVFVRFHDEFERTDDPSLVRIHALHRIGLPIRQWDVGPNPQPLPLTDQDKEALITRALTSQEGRTRLAQAMINPIRRNMNFATLSRQILGVQQLPEGALPFYTPSHSRETLENLELPAPMGNDQVGDAVAHAVTPLEILRTERVGPVGVNILAPPVAVDGPFGALARSGFGATLIQASEGEALVNSLRDMTSASVGNYLRLTGSPNPSNNGTWRITRIVNAGAVWIDNPGAVVEFSPTMMWEEFLAPTSLGGLDQFYTQSFYSSIAGYDPLGAPSPAPGSLETRDTAREALRQALMRAREMRPDDVLLDQVILDFEAIVGRPLAMKDVQNLAEDRSLVPPKRSGWVKLLGDEILPDD